MTTSTTLPLPNEFDDDTDFWQHPVCKNYESNRLGFVRNIKSKKDVGTKDKRGYYKFTCHENSCRIDKTKKNYYLHRFVWESFNGLIEKGKVIDHIDNDKSNNKLDNLQMITQSENCRKNNYSGPKLAQKIRAINVETGEVFIYRSYYGAAKDLHLERANIPKVLNGIQKTILSKKLNQRFTFQKVDDDKTPIVINNNNKFINFKVNTIKKVKIPLSYVRRLKINNN